MDYSHLIIFIIAGAFGGFMAGMLGVGGGIIFIPIIQEIVRNSAAESDKAFYVLANSLAIVLVVGISGSYKQYKLKNTNIKAAFVTGAFAILSSLLMSYILKSNHLNNPKVFSYIFAGVLIFTAIRMTIARQIDKKKESSDIVNLPDLNKFIPAGFLAGIITAITGLGGGVVMVPYFNNVLKLPIKFSTGLSLTVIPIIAAPLLVFYMISHPVKEVFPGLQTGYIMWSSILPIIIAAGIASQYGVKAANKISSKTLFTIFITFISLNLIKVLFF